VKNWKPNIYELLQKLNENSDELMNVSRDVSDTIPLKKMVITVDREYYQ
jgi:hypothetical protein